MQDNQNEAIAQSFNRARNAREPHGVGSKGPLKGPVVSRGRAPGGSPGGEGPGSSRGL